MDLRGPVVPPVPPPPPSGGRPADRFTPYTLEPRLKNTAEVQRALLREYPALLRDSGISGTVVVWFHIDEEGRVIETEVKQSSGRDA